ncbi:hypothetical protein HZB89_00845 [archaeon]|nr:hypothetical protein [archaeon]
MQKDDLLKIASEMILLEEVGFINYLNELLGSLDESSYPEKTKDGLRKHLNVLLIQSTNHAKWLNELQGDILRLL